MRSNRRKIYDCFTYFNEAELLELRLQHLWEEVDFFVLVEATQTFQKKAKPLFYADHKERFKAYQDKIIHLVVDDFPTFWSQLRPVKTWHIENHQREAFLKALGGADPDDLILVSDVDELPLAESLRSVREKQGIRVFEQYQSYYYLNNVCTHINDYGGKAVAQQNRGGYGFWRGPVLLEKRLIQNIKETRNYRDEDTPRIEVVREAGWHFSNMGGVEKLLYKMKSWSHSEYNDLATPEKVVENILAGRDLIGQNMKFELVDIKSSALPFPKELVANPTGAWSSMIQSQATLKSELDRVLGGNAVSAASKT